MSGGSYDYVYSRIQDVELRGIDANPRRAALQQLLRLVAKAMHDIEWVDSCDYGDGDEHAAIDAVLAFLTPSPAVIAKAAAFDLFRDKLRAWLALGEEKPA